MVRLAGLLANSVGPVPLPVDALSTRMHTNLGSPAAEPLLIPPAVVTLMISPGRITAVHVAVQNGIACYSVEDVLDQVIDSSRWGRTAC